MRVNKKNGTCVHDVTDVFNLTSDNGFPAGKFMELLNREIERCKEKGMVYPRIVTSRAVFGNVVTIQGKYREFANA